MVNENNKKTDFKIAGLDDIQEIKDIIEYVRGLVIKSQDLADKYESITSMRNATVYISAVFNLNDTDDMNREVIIQNYKEANEYYRYLYDSYDIAYAEARRANDMTILKSLNNTLNVKDELLFKTCYTETISYYHSTFFTKAFSNQEFNREYFTSMILSMTIQKYLTRKLEFYFDIDHYSKRDLKNSFISYGFDYFDDLPINYQRRILKLLNELVMTKGTNVDIRKILDIFGNSRIDIYKYILAKLYHVSDNGEYDYDNPYLIFYKTLADGIIDYEKDLVIGYESVVERDALWKVDKEEVLYHRVYNLNTEEYDIKSDRMFNTAISKYMSVDINIDAMANAMKISNLYNLIYRMEMEYKDKQDENNFGFFNREMSSNHIGIFPAILGLTSLILRSQGLTDHVKYFLNLDKVSIFNKDYQKEHDINIDTINKIIDDNEELINEIKNKQFTDKDAKENVDNLKVGTGIRTVYGFNITNAETLRLFNKLQTDGANTSYGMNNIENNLDIEKFLEDIQILLIQNRELLEDNKSYNELYRFFRNFNMANFSVPINESNMNQIYGLVNGSTNLQKQLSTGLSRWSDDIPLVLYLEDSTHDEIDKLNYIRQHLILGKCLAQHITMYPELKECFKTYVRIEGYRNPNSRIKENNMAIVLNENLRTDIENYLSYVNNDTLNKLYENNDMTGLFTEIVRVNVLHRNHIMTKYNLNAEDLEIYILTDKEDVTYYKELYGFIQLFYFPFQNVDDSYKKKKYTINDFVDVFNRNQEIRATLERFIGECQEYHIYRRFNLIFYSKFIQIRNMWGNKYVVDNLLGEKCFNHYRKVLKEVYNIDISNITDEDIINFNISISSGIEEMIDEDGRPIVSVVNNIENLIEDDRNTKYLKWSTKAFSFGILDTVSNYKEDILFSDIVKKYDTEFYSWLFPTDVNIKELTKEELQEFYQNKIFELSESIDTCLGTEIFIDFPFSGILDYIIRILYLLCTIFKSFTIDLIQSDTVLRIGDLTFNAFKMYDEINDFYIVEEEGQFKDSLTLQDVFRETIFQKFVENEDIKLKDEYKIQIIDEE